MKIEINNTELEIPEGYIPILLQPYSRNPEEAFKRATHIVSQMVTQGIYPFSPILHTHHFSLHVDVKVDYYDWDYSIYKGFKKPFFIITHDWAISKGCREEMEWIKEQNKPYAILRGD